MLTPSRATSNILCKKASISPLFNDTKTNMNWFSKIFVAVNWDIFQPVYTKISHKNPHWISKYFLKNLATGEHMKKRNGTDDKCCCSCSVSIGDYDHLFQFKDRP